MLTQIYAPKPIKTKNATQLQKKASLNKLISNVNIASAPVFQNNADVFLANTKYSQIDKEFNLNSAINFFRYESIASPVPIGCCCYQIYKYLTQEIDIDSFNKEFIDTQLILSKKISNTDSLKYEKEISLFNDIKNLCIAKLNNEISNSEHNELLELYIKETID